MKMLDVVLDIVAHRIPPSDLIRLVEELQAIKGGGSSYRASIERIAAIARRRYNPG